MATQTNPNHSPKSRPEPAADGPDVSDVLRQLRNRSPEESLGVNAQHGLWNSTLWAFGIIAVLFALLTVGPYLYERQFPSAAAKSDKIADDKEKKEPSNTTPPNTDPNTVVKKDPEQLKIPPKVVGKKEPVDVMGEGGTKKANPKNNPLDRKDDDLFKDFK